MTQIEKITNELQARQISQQKFCDALGIKQNTFSTWKSRGTSIPSKYIVRICNFFEWPADEFLQCDTENHEYDISNDSSINISNSGMSAHVHASIGSSGIDEDFLGSFKKLSFSDKVKVYALVAELSEGEKNEKQQQQTEQ